MRLEHCARRVSRTAGTLQADVRRGRRRWRRRRASYREDRIRVLVRIGELFLDSPAEFTVRAMRHDRVQSTRLRPPVMGPAQRCSSTGRPNHPAARCPEHRAGQSRPSTGATTAMRTASPQGSSASRTCAAAPGTGSGTTAGTWERSSSPGWTWTGPAPRNAVAPMRQPPAFGSAGGPAVRSPETLSEPQRSAESSWGTAARKALSGCSEHGPSRKRLPAVRTARDRSEPV